MASCRSFTVEPPLTDGFILSGPVLPFSLMLAELPAVALSTSSVQSVEDNKTPLSAITSGSDSNICPDTSIVHIASPTPAYDGGGAEVTAEPSILTPTSQKHSSIAMGVPTGAYVLAGSELDNTVVVSGPIAVGSICNSVDWISCSGWSGQIDQMRPTPFLARSVTNKMSPLGDHIG